jgi:hypothetical protein
MMAEIENQVRQANKLPKIAYTEVDEDAELEDEAVVVEDE